MVRVDFDDSTSVFNLITEYGNIPFNYIPDCKNIWDDLRDEAFTMILLNNPFLHKEIDVFEVKFDGSEERGGFLFPIALLESEEEKDKPILSYMFVAYRKLLLQLTDKDKITGVLSDSFKDAFILVIHNETVPSFDVNDYYLSLASKGFYEYHGEVEAVTFLPNSLNTLGKTIRLNKKGIDNFDCGYIEGLLKERLCKTNDFLTRFILVYQVVELYISEIHRSLLEAAIEKYNNKELNKNDFSERLKEISKESYQIKDLMKDFDEEDVCIEFRQSVIGLFNDTGYTPKNESLPTLMYALRNQIFHNYDLFIGHEDGLNQVVFDFEQVVLLLLMKKKIKQTTE